jgi:hypothetical protein
LYPRAMTARRPTAPRTGLRTALGSSTTPAYLVGLLALATVLGACEGRGAERPTLGVMLVGGGVAGGPVRGEPIIGDPVTGEPAVTGKPGACNADCADGRATCPDGDPGCAAAPPRAAGTSAKPSSEPTAKELRGRVQNWSGQAARVRAQVYDLESNLTVLAEAPVDAGGEFSLTLPGAAGVSEGLHTVDRTTYSCSAFGGTGDLTVTPERVAIAEVFLDVFAADAGDDDLGFGALSYAGFSPSSVFFVRQFYAAAAAKVEGSCTYTFAEGGAAQTYVDTYLLELKAGWNNVVYEHLDPVDERTLETVITTRAPPIGAAWSY